MQNEEFTYIPTTELTESATNPRRSYDDAALADLAESIKAKGILQPLLVRTLKKPNGVRFEIIFGARRFRAAKVAGLERVPVRIKELDDSEALEIQVIENLQRADVHPLDEALGYKALMKQARHSVADVAAKVGKSESYIYQRLKLCSLSAAAQKAFIKDQISAAHAVQIARLSPNDQKEALSQCLPRWKGGELGIGSRELARWIAREIHRDLNKAPFDTGDPDLLPSAKACADCPKRTGFTPALFPDIKDKDTCTDRGCWEGKIEATFNAEVKRLKAAGESFVQLSAAYSCNKKGIHAGDAWIRVKRADRCEHTLKGIVVEEGYRHDNLRRGQIIDVCVTKICKAHFGRNAASTPANPDRERARKAKHEKAFRIMLYQRLRPRLAPPQLSDLAAAIFSRLEHDAVKELCKVRGFEPPKRKGGYGPSVDFHAVGAGIGQMDPIELALFMNDCIYVCELSVPTWSDSKPEKLLATARELGVDAAAVRKETAPKEKAKKKIAKTNTPAANKARAKQRAKKVQARAKGSKSGVTA